MQSDVSVKCIENHTNKKSEVKTQRKSRRQDFRKNSCLPRERKYELIRRRSISPGDLALGFGLGEGER